MNGKHKLFYGIPQKSDKISAYICPNCFFGWLVLEEELDWVHCINKTLLSLQMENMPLLKTKMGARENVT